MNLKNQKGFTLIEVIVVAGIIAILAGILVPLIFGQIDESKKTRALADIKSIQTAISKFRMDTGAWPNREDGADAATNTVQVLSTKGNVIAGAADLGWPVEASNAPLKDFFGLENTRNYRAATWKGPYMSSMDADPWGNSYLVAAKNFEDKVDVNTGVAIPLPLWIISAGPDGIMQTPIDSPACYNGQLDPQTNTVLVGDDICLRFK